MKTLLSVVIGAGLLVGCSEKKSSAPAQDTSSGNPLTAPADYLKAAANSEKKAIGVVDITSLNKAIQLFQVDKGRLPKDLNELVTEKYMPQLPPPPAGSKIEYDAKTGTVKIVKQ
jgi:hypothetical protein